MKYDHYKLKALHSRECLTTLCTLALFSPLATSQEGPSSVPLGPFDLQASVLIEYVEDDNLFQSSTGQVSTSITTIAPVVELLFDNGVSGFSLAYGLENATFSGDDDVEDENYTDQRVDLTLGTLLGGLHRFEAAGAFVESHDRQSAGSIEGVGEESISSNELDYYEDVEYKIG